MQRTSFYIINGITLYRVLASLILLYLVIIRDIGLFKWMLAISFFTDAIDGFLARKYKVNSVMGARLDSIGDDLTVLMGILGLFVFRTTFLKEQLLWIAIVAGVFVIQVALALYRYGKFTSFHTYLAKIAAMLQGCFLILAFFLPQPPLVLFYIAAAVTFMDLLEEIIMIFLLPRWKADVKGLWWVVGKNEVKKNKEKI